MRPLFFCNVMQQAVNNYQHLLPNVPENWRLGQKLEIVYKFILDLCLWCKCLHRNVSFSALKNVWKYTWTLISQTYTVLPSPRNSLHQDGLDDRTNITRLKYMGKIYTNVQRKSWNTIKYILKQMVSLPTKSKYWLQLQMTE
jgi:hypothetical protein